MADRPTEARAYGAHNTPPPLFKLPAYAGVSLGMALWTQLVVSAYRADQALPLIDTIRYSTTITADGQTLTSNNIACAIQAHNLDDHDKLQ